MLETGGILIVMGVIFAVGAAGEWILSLFYRRYLRDTADMGRPGKKLVKLTKLRYETSYYLNGTVHNAKTMVNGMLEHYRLAGLRLWTWHHMATTAAFLCGAMGLAIGGAYVVGRYVPAVKEMLQLSGMNALVYTLAGGALAAMLCFWQNLLDTRGKRHRLESNLVDYFDNEKFHQLGREIALSGRVREIAGDRGRTEDPGSAAATKDRRGTAAEGVGNEVAAKDPQGTAAEDSGDAAVTKASRSTVAESFGSVATAKSPAGAAAEGSGRVAATKDPEGAATRTFGRADVIDPEESEADTYKVKESNLKGWDTQAGSAIPPEVLTAPGLSGGMTIADIISPREAPEPSEPESGESAVRTSGGTRKKTAAASTRARAKKVQIAQEEMEERRAGSSRRKEKSSKDVIIPLHPENSSMKSDGEAGVREDAAKMEAAATTAGNPSGNMDRAAREEELLKLLREYMGLE